jgi:hypothetical protein
MLTLIHPVKRAEPFDHADWAFEAKFDRFRAAADTVRGRLISRNGNRLQRFERVLDLLPNCSAPWSMLTLRAYSPSVSATSITRNSRWYKIINSSYSQRRCRAEWFLERQGLSVRGRMKNFSTRFLAPASPL